MISNAYCLSQIKHDNGLGEAVQIKPHELIRRFIWGLRCSVDY